jgi:bifunctional non-homologous end joining protein LigD
MRRSRARHWIFEEKYDGVRMLAYKEGKKISLVSRNAIDRTSRYPAIARELLKSDADTLLLDGEVVVLDAQNVSRFQLLQQGRGKPQYAVFDCLYQDGKDLRRLPLRVRRSALEQVVSPAATVRVAARVAEDGIAAFRLAVKRGLEGVIAKDSASPYIEGRSKAWLKVKVSQREEFVIGGFTAPEGARRHFGALLLGTYKPRSVAICGQGRNGIQ